MRMREISRRAVLAGGLGGGIALVVAGQARSQTEKVVIKLDRLISNGQIGDLMAAELGYFAEAGLDVEFASDGAPAAVVPALVSGEAAAGQFAESAQVVAARAAGQPVRIVACGFRTSAYGLSSLPKAPVKSAADMIGRRIGVQPESRVALATIIAKNNLDPSRITLVDVGPDKTPLLNGDVDAIGGWLTDMQALSVLGADRIDVLLADMALPTYGNAYFATDAAIETRAEVLAKFIGAVSRGWAWTKANPDEAARKLVAANPQLDFERERQAIDLFLRLSFNEDTARAGWGIFFPVTIEEQIVMYELQNQYPQGRPKNEDVFSPRILALTKDIRPKV